MGPRLCPMLRPRSKLEFESWDSARNAMPRPKFMQICPGLLRLRPLCLNLYIMYITPVDNLNAVLAVRCTVQCVTCNDCMFLSLPQVWSYCEFLFAEIKRFYKNVSIAKANGNLNLPPWDWDMWLLFFCLNVHMFLAQILWYTLCTLVDFGCMLT